MAGLLDNPLFELTGLDRTRPMTTLQNLAAARAGNAGSVHMGAPSQFGGYNKKNDEDFTEMPDLSPPDISSALDEGASRAERSVKGRKSEQMTGGDEEDIGGFHPQLVQLAHAMAPDDTRMAVARGGIGMAEAASHGSNFLAALASGAGTGMDYFQKLRAQRAEMALQGARLESENTLREAQGVQARAAAANYNRQTFAGNYPYVMALAKKSGQPQTMLGPMGTPITIMPNGSVSASGGGGGMPPGAAPGPGPGPVGSAPTGGAMAAGQPMPPPGGASAVAAPIQSGPGGAGAAQAGAPYLPPGVTKDMYDSVAQFAEMPGPMGDGARKQISEWAVDAPSYKGAVADAEAAAKAKYAGPIAGAEAAAKAKYETVKVLDPSGNFVVERPKDKWLAEQGSATTPDAGVAPAVGGAGSEAAPPPHQMPSLNSETLGVQQVIPQAPNGGGFSPVPANASSLTGGEQKMREQAAEVPKEWAENSKSLDTQITRMRSLAHLYKLTESNQWAEVKQDVASNLKEIYAQLHLPFTVSEDAFGDPAAVQAAIKDATITAFEQARQYTNRITNMELQGQTKTVAMPDLQPGAVYKILVGGISLAERDRQMMRGWQKAQEQGWRNPLAYEQAWYDANPADAWMQSTARRAGNLRGQPLPPKEELNGVATYTLRDGRLAKWNGQGFVPIKKSYIDLDVPPVPEG